MRPLRVFLCHASQDKPAVRKLYNALKAEGWIDPWLDKAKILPGRDWEMVIEKAVDDSAVCTILRTRPTIRDFVAPAHHKRPSTNKTTNARIEDLHSFIRAKSVADFLIT